MDEMNTTNQMPQNDNPAPETKKCPRCGKELPASAVFCGGCGTNLATGAPAPVATAVPQDTTPLKTADYFLMMLLFSLPLVGLILMIVWSFSGSTNVNRRNLSRASLIWYAISAVLSILLSVLLIAVFGYAAGALESSEIYPYYFSMIHPFF